MHSNMQTASIEHFFNFKSDVWSFGIVMWEIFTHGAIPWRGVTPKEIVRNLEQGVRLEGKG